MAAVKSCKIIFNLQKNCILRCSANFATSSGFGKTSSDPVIHTGQQWNDNDYRMVRFVDKQKKVNTQWAAKLIEEIPPTETKARVVSCDGGGGPTGHPKVYINLDKPGNHSCGYCGLRFEKPASHH